MHDLMIDFETVTPDLWAANEQAWKERLLKLPNWYQIPLINCNASHTLPDNTLVRFRGMVQDMHNPEFYFEKFQVYNTVTNETKHKTGKYKDTANILENEKINYTDNLVSGQRQTLVVVSIPGLNDWARRAEDKLNHLTHLEEQPNTSKRLNADLKLKRSYDEADEDSDSMEVVEAEANKERKVSERAPPPPGAVSREHLLNFPLPGVPSQACIVKIYDESEDLKVNSLVEVVGFLSVDPALSGEFLPAADVLPAESEAETITHHPPPSLVPRLHAVHVARLPHCNPLVALHPDRDAALAGAGGARELLLKALTELLLGDQLAAEYMICHLIACVYQRQDGLALGQLCLNVWALPAGRPQYARTLYDVIRQLVPASHFLPLTIDNLNTLALQPKKDYSCNRLTSGVLQLPAHTHLVLDEAALAPGRLQPAGVANLAALAHLVQHQRVEYDFTYYKMEFDADISVLVLSEGKSLLPSDFHLPLRPEQSSLRMLDAIVEAANYYLKEDILTAIRTYLTQLKLVKYTVADDVQFVEDDFIEMRSKADAENPVTGDDLHRLLVLARLAGLARGRAALDAATWRLARDMEDRRRARLRDRAANAL